jgi:hypothetical protein
MPIWKLVAHEERNIIFIETRNADALTVEFAALDFGTNEFLWDHWRPSDNWLTSLFAAKGNTLLLQQFAHHGNPDQKNLLACNISERKIRWIAEGFSFSGWDGSVIHGYQLGEDLVSLMLDVNTGNKVDRANEVLTHQAGQNGGFPVFYPEGSASFEHIREFVSMKKQLHIEGGVEYLEMENRLCISMYVRESHGLANYLLVFDAEGTLLFEQKLAEKLGGLGTDTFFVLAGCLFFVKNRLELFVYTFL